MPSRLERRTTGQEDEQGCGWGLLEHQVQPLKGRGVRPVEVFQDQEDRLTFGKFEEDGYDSFERFWR